LNGNARSNRRNDAWNPDYPQPDNRVGDNSLTKKDKAPDAPTDMGATDEPEKRSLVRHPLHTLAGLISEGARVYRQMRDGKMDHQQGRSLVWVLGQLRAMVETQALERLEQRLEELAPSIEGKTHGHTTASRPSGSTH
jgi:hypothetical protein